MNSTFFEIDYQINNSNTITIKEHLLNCDDLFEPPLSSYVNISQYSAKLSKKATNFEAWHCEKIVGLVSVYFNDLKSKVAYVSNVSIEIDYQGNGIASMLLSSAILYGEKLGFQCIRLEVFSRNIKAINLYRKFGFEVDASGSGKVEMVKYF